MSCTNDHNISSYEKIYYELSKDIKFIYNAIDLIYKCIDSKFDETLCKNYVKSYSMKSFSNHGYYPESYMFNIIFNDNENLNFRCYAAYVYYKFFELYIIESHGFANLKILNSGNQKLVESMFEGLKESNRIHIIKDIINNPTF